MDVPQSKIQPLSISVKYPGLWETSTRVAANAVTPSPYLSGRELR